MHHSICAIYISRVYPQIPDRVVSCVMLDIEDTYWALLGVQLSWPLHDISITSIVWCMTCQRGVGGGGAYIAQWPCNSIAIV